MKGKTGVGHSLFVAKECDPDEPRVAASPDSVKRLCALGLAVTVESGAGLSSRILDREYEAAGAAIGKPGDMTAADIILKVRPPTQKELKSCRKNAAVVAIMEPYGNQDALESMAKSGIAAFSMELMPRITRAQSMDVLSSQANLAGYQAVIDAAYEYDRGFPMMMTAAGTVPAAKVFVMGAGVAGLQAIATARRLGAIVTATDVRPAAKEQVASLGAKFVAVEDEEFRAAETAGGYAKEMSPQYQEKQARLVADHIARQDVVITTALIPGRPAPRLVTAAMVQSMRPGSVIVDLAVERGGNVEGSEAGKINEINGVKILGYLNVPGRIAATASLLYAKNLCSFVETLVDRETGQLAIDRDDELVKATLLTFDGSVVHTGFAGKSESVRNTGAGSKVSSAKAAAKPARAAAKPTRKVAEKPVKAAQTKATTGRRAPKNAKPVSKKEMPDG